MPSTESAEGSGVSLTMLTRAALLATIIGRGLAPAVPGLAVGIANSIVLSGRVAAFLSQLVAAGGVAAAIRLGARTLRSPKIDLGYRLVALPGSAVVIAFVMAAWARPLEPEMCGVMALAAVAAALSGALASLRVSNTRAGGLVLGSAGLSGLCHLLARELVARAAERLDNTSLHWATAVATLATLFDLTALGLTLVYLGRGKRTRVAIISACVLVPAVALGVFAAGGAAPGAGMLRVLAERTLGQLSRTPAATLPSASRFAITTAVLSVAGLCVLRPRAGDKVSVVLGLALLSLGAPDMPLPALWLVVATLLAPKQLAPFPAPDPARSLPTAASK